MSREIMFRTGTETDVEALIDLLIVSSWGGIRQAWEAVRRRPLTWRDQARLEVGDPTSDLGYPRFIVAEVEGKLAAGMLLNLLDANWFEPDGQVSPEHRGIYALMRQAAGTLFVREIAVHAPWRGRGLAREMLRLTYRFAASNGGVPVTLMVNDANPKAFALYRSEGFKDVDAMPSVGHPGFPDGSMLMLLRRHTELGDNEEGAASSAAPGA